MPWTADDIPDLAGTTAVVTGANGGLGLESARALAGAGAHVVMAARDQAKALAARDDVLASRPSASLEIVELDLACLDSVRAAAVAIAGGTDRVDLLLNNAGLMAMPEGRTSDGFERQLGVNHLGHWVLTARLLPLLGAAPAARVVAVTSVARHLGRPVDPADPNLERRYRPWSAYGRSKLANHHFSLGLHRRLAAAGSTVASLAAHPGLSNTDLQARMVAEGGGGSLLGPFFHRLAQAAGMSPAQGALPQLRAATDPAATSGQLYAPFFGTAGPPVGRPLLRRIGLDRSIDRLWELSTRLTGEPLEPEAS